MKLPGSVVLTAECAAHDEVILTVWPEGEQLIGSASAAKEKNFGRGENYVLPQYLELSRIPGR